MHEVVANFLCKLLEVRAFDHLQSKLLGEEVKAATGNWEVGQRASTKLVEWCQDQWRRKDPCLHRQPKLTVRVTCGTILRNVKMVVNIKDLYGNPGYRFKKIRFHRNSQ